MADIMEHESLVECAKALQRLMKAMEDDSDAPPYNRCRCVSDEMQREAADVGLHMAHTMAREALDKLGQWSDIL